MEIGHLTLDFKSRLDRINLDRCKIFENDFSQIAKRIR